MRPYLVGTPPFDQVCFDSGGCRVIHKLVYELNKRGQEAYTTNSQTNPEWNTPYYGTANNGQSYGDWKTERDPIAVYPEITFGNPMETRTVVRWLLNNAGKLSGPKEFPPTDILFAFNQMFNSFNLPPERIMFMPVLDTDTFKDTGQKRTHDSFYIGKGWCTNYFAQAQTAIEITKVTARDQQELSNTLQTSTVLYCYDNMTGMTEIARLCGCPVVIIPNGEYTKEQYDLHPLGWDGLGWATVPNPFDSQKFMEKYEDLKLQFLDRLDYFIEVTQNA